MLTFNYSDDDRTITLKEINSGLQHGVCLPHAAAYHEKASKPLVLVPFLYFSEQNGKRGTLKLDKKIKLLNFLEDIEAETDTISYKPFEIITIGIKR